MDKDALIFVAGHRGLVGSAILRRLRSENYTRVLTRSRAELDLTDQRATQLFFAEQRPEYVFLAAAKVGGILANATQPKDFLRDNLYIQANIIDAGFHSGVKKLLVLGSSCIYPRLAPQPMKEEYLLTGPFEPTNEAYAIAKVAGLKMAQAYCRQLGFRAICIMPTNLFGPGDNFDSETSHVVPALLRKFHEARLAGSPAVTVWGSGTPRREFLYVDDLAEAALFLMRRYESPEIINVGVGHDITIRELAELIREVVGYSGEITFDRNKPDGAPRKLLDVSRLRDLGWSAQTDLREALERTYHWYVENEAQLVTGGRTTRTNLR